MTVLYNERTLPLTANASKPEFSTGLVLAWDFTGVGSLAEGEPWKYAGATKPTLVKVGVQTLVTLAGEPGRVSGDSSSYEYTNLTDYGAQVGNGDFTVAIRFSTGPTLPTASSGRILFRLGGTAGNALLVNLNDSSGLGWYVVASGSAACPLGSTISPTYFPVNTVGVVVVQRIAGVMRIYTANASLQADAQLRYGPGAVNTAPLDATWAAKSLINTTIGVGATTPALQSVRLWNVGLDTPTVTALAKDYWAAETNAAVVDAIAITAPAAGATISTTSVISGTYAGAAPAGIAVQHGAGSWVAGTGMTISGGTWSGTFVLAAGASGNLGARKTDNTAVVSPLVANIIVSVPASSITFAAKGDAGFDTAACVQPFRLFQRDGSNAAIVRIKGAYVGSPATLQYRWAGLAWVTLDAAPAAGVFDKTLTLTGPGQGALEVRFSDVTSVFASLEAVGVGDVFIVAGQSNHVGGGAGEYVAAVAPSANPGWKAPIYAKNGAWRENVETSVLPFSSIADAVYAVQGTGNAWGSYFGRLATLCMEQGVPVAFVPCAIGSTSVAAWAVSAATSSLYGAAAAVATTIGGHKAVLWWQGEADAIAANSQATYESALNAIIDGWYAQFGKPWVLMNINATGTGAGFAAIHAAIASVAASNAHVDAIADMNGAFSSSIHYAVTTEINNVALRAFDALDGAYAYSPEEPADTTAPVLSGVITESGVTSDGFTFACPAATGDVVGYDSSIDGGGTWLDMGVVRTRTVAGRPPSTAHATRWRAYDGASPRNLSAELSLTITTTSGLSTRSVSIQLGNAAGSFANLSGLKVAFYDESSPHLQTVARYQSATETTDGSGNMAFSCSSSLASGGTGHVTVLASDGSHYNGPVVVS